jgi:hypothetical protein
LRGTSELRGVIGRLAPDLLHPSQRRTIPSLVRPHWLTTPAAAVNRFTGCVQIGHFVMAIRPPSF